MRPTRPSVLDDSPACLDAIWASLDPGPAPTDPRIRAVMIASVDGTTTVDGRSGGLGTPTDRLVYDAVRARADLVLAGSGTVLTEGYGPAGVSPVWADRRRGPAPVVVALTRTLPDELVDHCRAAGAGLQIAASHTVPEDRLRAARDLGVTVHAVQAGPLGAAVRALATRLGAREVALEGGPHLLGAMLAEGGVDELVLSVAPEFIVGGDDSRLATGPQTARVPMRVVTAFTGPDGGLYTRWVVTRGPR